MKRGVLMKNNTFKKTERTLYNYRNIDLKIENIDLHIERLLNDVSIAGVSYEQKFPTNGFNSSVENEVIKREEHLTEKLDSLKKKKLKTIAHKQKITNALDMLKDEQYRLVELRYFDTKKKRKTWVEIGMILSIDSVVCCKMKNKIVNRLKEEIFGQY